MIGPKIVLGENAVPHPMICVMPSPPMASAARRLAKMGGEAICVVKARANGKGMR